MKIIKKLKLIMTIQIRHGAGSDEVDSCCLLCLLQLQFTLSAAHFIIVVDVAALTLALCVDGSLPCVMTLRSQRASTILVIAVVAHAHRVQREVSMRAGCDCALLAPRAACWLFCDLGCRLCFRFSIT